MIALIPKLNPALAVLLLALAVSQPVPAQNSNPAKDPAGAGQAWAEISRTTRTFMAPPPWRGKTPTDAELQEYKAQVRKAAVAHADKAEEFLQRYPEAEELGDARIAVVFSLTYAIAAGDAASEKRANAFVTRVLADKGIPEDQRVGVYLYADNIPFFKSRGDRLFTEGLGKMEDEFEASTIARIREGLKIYPGSTLLYTFLVAQAQRAKGSLKQELAAEIVNSPKAPESAKALATHLINQTKPYQVGKPLDLKFTALDGREVDLAALKGKVVLIEFWSTDCGPCIAELPALKQLYEKHHGQGFEVVAISLDSKEKTLRQFIKENKIPWPQHFDGKGWGNQFAIRYGIFSIPTKWLVDRHGNLRFTETRFNLEGQLEKLLEEK